MPSSRQLLGADAERRVRRHYLLRGYRVLEANARAGGNEVDVVLRRGDRLVFCEVKCRSSDRFGTPAEAVRPEKIRRLTHAAEAWLARNPQVAGLKVAFEVAAVRGRRIERMPF